MYRVLDGTRLTAMQTFPFRQTGFEALGVGWIWRASRNA